VRKRGGSLSSRRVVPVLAILIAAFASPASADAKTLSIAKAKAAAQKFLDRENALYPYEPPKRVTTCTRKSARTVDCGYRALNDNGTAECGTVRARLKTRKSKRPTVRYKADPYMCAAG
jgi:hypothetical protein